MSTGVFEAGKYEQNGGSNVWPCKPQPETKGLTLNDVVNAYPSEPVTAGLPRLKLRKSRREAGLPIRTVTVKLTAAGTGANSGYLSGTFHTIPVFTEAAWEDYDEGQVGTYLGIACEFAGKSSGQ